ncbi:uncharacterized protein TRUGW13939_09743 [Talaromyces rugulosus]|uniref:Chromo domain-containing protein n=1 Tax=Talaromyces rugulosus TaxID=121627 RepID=A0A7H8R869_TALRU|nr:uncharacterized protein TRUGW13939_09743 [Talaromyces rugulosus]QKX62582.1 hypothetical protein TRUGW13939_09743 [Talaromyces rugulosus]
MPRRRTAAEVLDGAGDDDGRFEINGNRIFRSLACDKPYKDMLELWAEYQNRNPGASIHDLATAKRFMKQVAETSRGNLKESPMIVNPAGERVRAPTLAYIQLRWQQFIAMWPRQKGNEKLAGDLTESVYHYIRDVLRREIPLSLATRPIYWFTLERFIVLQEHTWRREWSLSRHTRTLVNDHAGDLLACYTSGRVGEHHESSARRGSGRGLLYRDIVFHVIRNAKGNAELIVCPTRDPKGATLCPSDRPEGNLYEDMQPLYANPVLPFLSQALADGSFVRYKSWSEIKEIPVPLKGFPIELEIHPEKLDCPVLQEVDGDGPQGKIRTAGSYAKRLAMRGRHAGFDGNIKVHDMRREALVKADENGYSIDARMQFAGQRDPKIFNKSYNHKNRVSGVDSYWGRPRREDHLQEIRASNLKYKPQLLHWLPAKQRYDLEHGPEFVSIAQELADLQHEKQQEGLTGQEVCNLTARQGRLYEEKRQLIQMALKAWQEDPQSMPPGNKTGVMDPQTIFFERTRRLDPVRDRLAENLFLDVPLRSETGDMVIEDMIRLCKGAPEVAYRPSCRPTDKGQCLVEDCGENMERLRPDQRWPHVYKCYREDLIRQHGFAQLCYICDEWILGRPPWIEHCTGHLEQPETLPIRCEPVNFRLTVAWPGYCITCIFSQKNADERLRSWEYPNRWKEHVDRCLREYWAASLSSRKAVSCCDPRCQGDYATDYDLRFHMIDWHGYPLSRSAPKGVSDPAKGDVEPFTFVYERPNPSSGNVPPVDIKLDCYQKAPTSSDLTAPGCGDLIELDTQAGVSPPPHRSSPGMEALIDPWLLNEAAGSAASLEVTKEADVKMRARRDADGRLRPLRGAPSSVIELDCQGLVHHRSRSRSPASNNSDGRAQSRCFSCPTHGGDAQGPVVRKRKRSPHPDTTQKCRRVSERAKPSRREQSSSSQHVAHKGPPPELIDGQEEYLVDRILDERIVPRGRGFSKQYLVKWRGYQQPTWTVARLLDDTKALDQWLA